MTTQIPPQVFFNCVEKLNQTWTNKFADEPHSIILANGKMTPHNEKTTAIFSWIFGGYNLTDTILFLAKDKIIIFASERKMNFLSTIRDHPNSKKFGVTFSQKEEDNTNNFTKIWTEIHGDTSNPKVGSFLKDVNKGSVVDEFFKFVEQKEHTPFDISAFFNECTIVKGKDELENIKKSSLVTTYFLSKLIKEIQTTIDDGADITHRQLADSIHKHMSNEAELKKCTVKLGSNSAGLSINKDFIDTGASVSVQSGGNYSPKITVTPNSDKLKSDCILLGIGSLYKSWNSFVGRTLLIDPNEKQKLTYKKILALAKVIQQNLRPGVVIQSIYKKAAEFVSEHLPGVEVPKSFGFGVGIYLLEPSLEITENNTRVIEPGFSFLISCNFHHLECEGKNGATKVYAVQISDTVIVSDKGQEVLTSAASTAIADISYELGDDDEEKRESKKNPKIIDYGNSEGRPVTRRGKKHEATMDKLKSQKKRAEHQMELKKKKFDELKERVNENFIGDFKKQKNIQGGKLESYKSREDFPREMKRNQIYVDAKNNSILLPINGKHVPFNIHILKSVVKNDEGKFASLRFNFHLPGTVPNFNFPKFNEACVFVKEMVFRSQHLARITDLERQIKALQKKVKLDMSQKHAKEDIVEQEAIRLNKGKRPILRDLFARPGIGQKKVKGNLECHLNGFRYTTIKGEVIDVAFSNIKYAFFQPCEREIIGAIHFRLHEPILIGKKKSEDVQFFSEGGPNAEDIGGRGRGYDDEDDEERQKEARRRLDKEFITWMRSCEEFKGNTFQFQSPKREAGFYGNPFNNTTLLQPTKNCLINVTENRFFIAPIDEIEIACFERMYANVKSFDMILLMKDYENFMKISSIPIKDVEKVKDLLDSRNIIFYDQGKNLNWIKFLAIIRKDFKKFVDDGAWLAWDEADQEEEQNDQDEDESFSVSESDFDESDDDSDSDSNLNEEDSDDDDSSAEEQLSEEGLSSDELDERAEMEDRERDRREIERQREKQKMKRRK